MDQRESSASPAAAGEPAAPAERHPGVAYADGRYLPLEEATIPLLDRGFLRSDATYDVTHVWKGSFFRLQDHIDRFFESMAALRFNLRLSKAEVAEILMECVRRSGLRDAYVQMTCTRGVPPVGTRDPRLCVNRFYAFAGPFVWIANEEQRRRGLRLLVSRIERIPPESVDPRVKNFHWIDLTRGIFEALDQQADVATLVDRDGNLTEGAGFNIFLAEKGRLATPIVGVFEGMTRRTVFDLCAEIGQLCTAELVLASRLADAEEVFISSTAGGIMPVTIVNGVAVGDGKPGPITRRLHDLYWSKQEAGWLGTPVDYGS
jgi:branched-chain amino acid aminotransferase